ncbi:polymorphic toxin-type HINT domain-containing protein [Leptospira gomenensis]|uniref:polymorphic toxin-type HINT domain-containing protein n=1 Tax=Leptospira gomenensis TaxID=2484974 RepID=UPI001FF006C0|nr:polymorphic toxin-type HINT domain-containing protein [Leptospira gomenensis]
MNLSYSYAGGFGAGVNVGGGGLGAGVSYNEKSGFGVSAGIMGNGVSLMYTENFGKGDVRASHGWQAQVGGLEVNYDNLSGYSASFQAASAMFGNLKISTALTWSEQNGFNGSASYNFLSKEQMAKEAAKGAQKNQGNLFLNIMDGLGYNLGGREGEPTLLDNITGAFSGAWNTVKGAGNWIGNKASSAWDGITGLFGGKAANNGVDRTTARGLDAIALYNAAMDEVACFVKGTKILTQDNTKTIENVEVGDIVFAFNEVTLELGYKKVLEVFRNKTDILIKISLEDNTIIETTEGHPFYIKEKGFVLAKDLTKKDRVVNSNLKEITIKEINRVEVDSIDTYNFHVEDFHTYFVSNSNILVHNTSVPENPIEIMKQKLNNYYDKLSRGVQLTKQESDQLDRLEGAMGAGVYARHQNEKGEWVWTQIGEMKTRSTSDEVTNGGVDGRPNVRVLKDGDKIQTQYGELTVRVLDSKNAPITWIDPKTGNAMIDGLGHRQFIYGPNGEEYSYKGTVNGTEAVRASAEYAATKPNLWNRLFNFGKSENNTGSLPSSTGTRAW